MLTGARPLPFPTCGDRGRGSSVLDATHLRFFTRRTLLELLAQAGLRVDQLRVTPVPLPLIVPRRLHGAWLSAAHALSAWASHRWPGGLAYQFVAVCRAPAPREASTRESAGAAAPSAGRLSGAGAARSDPRSSAGG